MNESYEWILACIKSCKNLFQLDSCKVLVQLFKMKFENEKGFALYNGELLNEISDANTFMSVDA